MDQNFRLNINHVRLPYGRGRIRLRGASMEEYARRKYDFISYNIPDPFSENDYSCLAYSLVVAKAAADGKTAKLKSLKRYFSKIRTAAHALCTRAGVSLNANHGGGLEEVDKFQKYLRSEYRICVYSNRYGSDVIYEKVKGSVRGLKTLNLMLDNNHFYAISNCKATFATVHYCESCHKGYSNRFLHRYPYKCRLCFTQNKCNNVPYDERIECNICNRRFNGTQCFLNHRIGDDSVKSVCEIFKGCFKCDRLYKTTSGGKHVCDSHFCKLCMQTRPLEHQCFIPQYQTKRDYDTVEVDEEDGNNDMQLTYEDVQKYLENQVDDLIDVYCDTNDTPPLSANEKKKLSKDPLFIFYDFETTQNTRVTGSRDDYLHKPILCVAHNVCKWCIDTAK